MAKRAGWLLLVALLSFTLCQRARAADARFDLVGPKIDVRVTRNGVSLPIATVPNLKAGDRIWLHPDLPATQSVKYLLICVFLRGVTNPPPENWFTRIETWDPKVRAEGAFVTVPAEAQQALLFLAPETGGDFSTLRSAVRGKPGAFVRSSQDLIEAGFEQARIEKYVADIRRVPPSDAAELQRRSDLMARTLALKPNPDCFKRPPDTQSTCLMQTGTQSVLDDGHGQSVSEALNGPTSDLITQASFTPAASGGLYSAYVGAVVDVVRILGNLHVAQYQYIPAISFPQNEQMNLRLNTPPSFHNPKSVIVIALPTIQNAVTPPLRPADPNHVSCLIQPAVALPVEGAPLVFSSDFAHDMVLHLNTPPGAPAEADIPLTPDAYFGGLVLQKTPEHHVLLRDPLVEAKPADVTAAKGAAPAASGPIAQPKAVPVTLPMPVMLTGTVHGRWGFDEFTGPTMALQQLPGSGWHIVQRPGPGSATGDLIAGRNTELYIASTGPACVHVITARPDAHQPDVSVAFKSEPMVVAPADAVPTDVKPSDADVLNKAMGQVLALSLPLSRDMTPGDLHLGIQQYDQVRPDELSTRTFAEPATVTAVELHSGDKSVELTGTHLSEISQLTLGDLVFTAPAPQPYAAMDDSVPLTLVLAANAPPPPTKSGDRLTAKVGLRDGRVLPVSFTVASARPSLTILSKTATPVANNFIALSSPDDVPLSSTLTFTLKSPGSFPRNGQVEIETLDGALRAVLTLAPSGGLLLQDPHTIVATLDPLRSFGPSAFGALRLRAVFPAANTPATMANKPAENGQPAPPQAAPKPAPPVAVSDWVPLVTLVRLPELTQLQCPSDPAQPCTLNGKDLFLLQSLSTDPAFATSTAVPDGFTGSTLSVPRPNAQTLFLHLRDDPAPVNSANFPAPPPPTPRVRRERPATSAKNVVPTSGAAGGTQTQESPAEKPGSAAVPQ
jgi:hypothetical protein